MSWRRVQTLAVLIVAGTLTAGCSAAHTQFEPRLVARGELTLRYHDGVEIYAGRDLLTDAPSFDGLAQYVRCVPRAVEHAEDAQDDGASAVGTGITGSILGIAGLGGLSGLAFMDEDNKAKAFAILGSGVAVGLLGMTLAIISRGYKNSANGHAVDALNYYNDRVGVYGGTCDNPLPQPMAPPAPGPLADP